MAIQSAIKGSKINRGELLSSFLKNDGELDEAYQTRQGEGLAGLVNQGIIRALPQAGQYEFLQDYSFNDRTPRSPDTTGAGQAFDTEAYFQSRLEEPDLATMEERERKRIQGQIDLIRTGETRELERIREQTADFKGSQRGMSARRGLGGSSFGGAQKQKITSAQGEKERLLGEETQAKIQMAMGNADDRALRRFEIERASVDRASAEYMDFLEREKTESKAEMKDLAASNVPREAIDDEYYNKSIEQTGYSPTVWDFLYDSELAKLSKIDYTYAFQGNNLIRYGQDPETGELVTDTYSAEELGIPNDVSPEFIENENTGEYIWFDKNAPVDENGMLQTNSLGKLKKPASSGGGQQSQWQYTEGVKAGFSLDREDGMTKEDAVNKYGPTLGVDWVNSQYGGTEKEKFDEKFYESQSSEMAEWDKKIKDEPKKYKKIGKEVYRQDFWKDNLVYTYPF